MHKLENLDCFPYEVAEDPEKGRILVATRDIQPGELILKVRDNIYYFFIFITYLNLNCFQLNKTHHFCFN